MLFFETLSVILYIYNLSFLFINHTFKQNHLNGFQMCLFIVIQTTGAVFKVLQLLSCIIIYIFHVKKQYLEQLLAKLDSLASSLVGSLSCDCECSTMFCEHVTVSFGAAASCFSLRDLNQGDVDQANDSQICYSK